ncbi:MAG: SDR family NAD(P)-dependent oxidoreductase [Gemmatimonadota bacterium]
MLTSSRALITGASAGIGAACARKLAAEGFELALWARREERLDTLAAELSAETGASVRTAAVDVRDRGQVERSAAELSGDGWTPDILINNAGLASGLDFLHEGDVEDWDRMIDTNVKGLLFVTRQILPQMVARGTGHVVNIGSTAGHTVYPRGNVYNATKFAVRALSQGMNLDVAGTGIRVSSVDPGMVETEFSEVRFAGDRERARDVYQGFQPLSADDVADAVHFVVTRPPHVNAINLVLVPTAQRGGSVVDRT